MTKLTKSRSQDDIFLVSPPVGGRARAEADRGRIFDSLETAISAGTFGRSGRLPTERALADQFSTNRNTVRKVLDDLAALGLIERHVGRGTFVVDRAATETEDATNFSLTELLEARLVFEPYLPDLVVERATEKDIALMEAYLVELRTAKTWAEFKEAKYCLHLMIVRSARNSFLTAMFEQIVDSRRRAQWGRPGSHPAPMAEVRELAWHANAAIVEALRNRDAATARQRIRKYLIDTLSTTSQS